MERWEAMQRALEMVERRPCATVPYEEFCRQREVCAGKSNCPLDPTCAD